MSTLRELRWALDEGAPLDRPDSIDWIEKIDGQYEYLGDAEVSEGGTFRPKVLASFDDLIEEAEGRYADEEEFAYDDWRVSAPCWKSEEPEIGSMTLEEARNDPDLSGWYNAWVKWIQQSEAVS